jgi:hypothetical protein
VALPCYKYGPDDALSVVPVRKRHSMSRLIRPLAGANAGLSDPRSTGARPPKPVRDITALRGTIKTNS